MSSDPAPPASAPSPDAFRAVYRDEFGYVWASLQRLGVRGPELQDLAHDVFVTAFKRWATYDALRPVRPWLFGITYRVVLDFRRKFQNHREVVSEAVEVPDPVMNAEERVATRQARDLALKVIDTMDLDQKAVFVMHEIEGYGMPQIAELVGAPLNTAYSRLRLARRHFDKAVQGLQAQERRS